MQIMMRWIAVGLSAAVIAVGQNAIAQSGTTPPQTLAPGYTANMPPPGPYEMKLDTLLAARDYDAVTRAAFNEVTDQETAVRALDWLRAQQVAHGQGTFISFLYSASLWRIANSLPPERAKNLKATAATQLALTRWLIRSEGFQCADSGSPSARLSFIESQLAAEGQYLDQLPANERASAQRDASVMLIFGFEKRENDDWLCRSGPLYMAKYFKKHPNDPGAQVAIPGSVGRNLAVPNDPEIQADFLPFETWRARREQEIQKINAETGGPPIPEVLLSKYHKVM